MSFLQKYTITPHYLTKPSKRRSGKLIMGGVKFIVAHDTGNPSSTATNNVSYYERTRDEQSASAHIFVDDKEIIECIPALTAPSEKAWHVLYRVETDNHIYGYDANDAAIGVEYCYGGHIDADEAYRKYVWVIANICERFNLDPATAVVGHFFLDPTRKTDPVTGLAQSRRTYDQLLKDIVTEYHTCVGAVVNAPLPPTTELSFTDQAGKIVTTAKLNIRKDTPRRTADIVQVLPAGTHLDYVGWVTDGEAVNGNSKWYRDANGHYFWSGGVTSQEATSGETTPQPIIRNYLDDDTVVLSRGSIDTAGAKTYGKSANVPDEYIVALQNDLSTLGFRAGAADGVFGSRTMDGLKTLQECALSQLRQVNGQPINVNPSYQGDPHGECDQETRQEIKLWLEKIYRAPAPSVPAWKGVEEPNQENGISFAEPTVAARCWPILTHDRGGREVAYQGVSGKIYGRTGRRFLADRADGRYHVGVDLWGAAGDIIVACEDGEIVNHYHFYNNVYALFEQCDSGLVINYGEVKPDSWREFGVQKGSRVKTGQPIARVGQMTNSSMCHFEMYVKGTTVNQRYYKGTNSPKELLNPTRYLLHIAELGLSQINHGELPPIQTPEHQPNHPDSPGMGLLIFHSAFANGVRWRLTRQGLEIEGSGIERTHGMPTTITKIWESFGDSINRWAAHFNVPCVLIIATIATETSGNANAIRKEPHYESDSKTPNQISTGLMQTLISTARDTLGDNTIDRGWLLTPNNSIKAGTSYIAGQRSTTLFDPPKVACAYNAGKLKENTGDKNRWKMKQFPIGTSEHCDRYVKWFNDAVAVLETHAKKPTVPYDIYFS
jgi:N-acetylmuramoyl-L-alanine amidase CwlA/murein DD-endopeptidase MepM/ murein hydrolase activator NlpD